MPGEACTLWEVLAQRSVGVLVGAALPRTASIAGIQRSTGGGGDVEVPRRLTALIPGDGLQQASGQAGQFTAQAVAQMKRVRTRQMDEFDEARVPLHQRADRRAVLRTDDHVAFPMSGLGAVLRSERVPVHAKHGFPEAPPAPGEAHMGAAVIAAGASVEGAGRRSNKLLAGRATGRWSRQRGASRVDQGTRGAMPGLALST